MAEAAADPEACGCDPECDALERLLTRLRKEGKSNGHGAGSVYWTRAKYFLEACRGNVVQASGLYWEVRHTIHKDV